MAMLGLVAVIIFAMYQVYKVGYESYIPGWDKVGKLGNQVATKSLPSSEIFGKNPAFIIIYVNLIY